MTKKKIKTSDAKAMTNGFEREINDNEYNVRV